MVVGGDWELLGILGCVWRCEGRVVSGGVEWMGWMC